jgi:hypothetical protein
MAVTAAAPTREHEKPMSWARAVIIAVGLFFLAIILLGQVAGYFFTISTLSTLARMEQGCLALGLLSIGLGLVAFEIAFIYDPKPVIPGLQYFFVLLGLAITAVGGFFLYQIYTGAWHEYLPDATSSSTIVNGQPVVNTTYWPNPGQQWLFNEAWFQPQSIDLQAIGILGLVIGLGVFFIAILNPAILSGRFMGPTRDFTVRVSMAASVGLLAIWLTLFTFEPAIFEPTSLSGAIGNALLFIALMTAMLTLVAWLLPVMVSHRGEFMPGNYLHGVVGLLGTIGIPLLLIWALLYPVVNWIHSVDTQQVFVQCSQKNDIPASCTFTPFTGYILCAIVFSIPFGLLVAGLYFWSTKRNLVVLGGTYGIVWSALAVTLIHQDDPTQTPFGLLIATGIILLAFAWTWATQVEFATTRPQPLGCVGQWLVLGTLLFFYLMGFALLSMPSFFETEALALFYTPGQGGLHDAFWALLLMGGLGLFQITVLLRRKPMGNTRKFALWALLFGTAFMVVGSILGFHWDILYYGPSAFGAGQAWFLAGAIFAVIGILATLYAALQTGAMRWFVGILVVALISAAWSVIIYSMQFIYVELVVLGFFVAMVGAYAYVAAGPDPEDLYALA